MNFFKTVAYIDVEVKTVVLLDFVRKNQKNEKIVKKLKNFVDNLKLV